MTEESGDKPGKEEAAGAESAKAESPDFAETTVLTDSDVSGEGAEAPDAVEDDLEARLVAAEARADENLDKYVRAVAELENVRRRSARDVENARRFGSEKLAESLLAVVDSLEMGLQAAENATVESLVEGKQATLKLLLGALEKSGVEALDPEGEPFDPELHEAMTMQPSDTAEPNTVLTVIQRGYRLSGRLLRPARVIVSKQP